MRILWFNLATTRDDPYLAFTIEWLNACARHVKGIDVITMRRGPFEVLKNVRVYSVGKEKGYSEPRRAWEFYRILSSLLLNHRYDVCFAHMMPLFAVMAAPLLRLRQIPLVLWYTHKSVTRMLRLATWCAARVVTASPESFRIPSPKVRVIGHGIDTARFVPAVRKKSSSSAFTVLTVGRITRIKHLDCLIQSAALVREQAPELAIRIRIIGSPLTADDQRYYRELKLLMAEHAVQEQVTFEGGVAFQEIVTEYQQADCFVNLCPTGGVDKAVLEAMSCGVGVIVANQTFNNILGTELTKIAIIDADAHCLAERLMLWASFSENHRQHLREHCRAIVVRDHDLQGLCTRLLHHFREVRVRNTR